MVIWNRLVKHKQGILYFLGFLFICYISYCFPFMGDDLTLTLEKADSFRDIADYSLNFGNGRYIGNFLVLLLVNNVYIRVLSKAVCFFLIFILISKLFTNESIKSSALVFILLLGMPISIFRQTFAWTAGFQNYFPPVMLLLLCAYFYKKYNFSGKVKWILFTVLTVFAAQFFVENCTAFSVIIGIAAVIFSLKQHKNVVFPCVFTAVSVCGAILMALHPKTEFVENYRSSCFSDIHSFFPVISDSYGCVVDTLRQGFFLWTLLSLICISILNSGNVSRRLSFVFKVILGFFPIYCTFETFLLDETYTSADIIRKIFGSLLPILYFFCCIYVIWSYLEDSAKKRFSLIMFTAGVLALAIVMPFTPNESRCMLLAYICFVIAVITLSDVVNVTAITPKIAVLTLTSLVVCYGFVYTDIAHANRIREDYISEKRQQHAEIIVIPDLPHNKFLHFNFDNLYFTDYYYYYYEQPGDIQFITTEWNKWINFIDKED